MSKAGTHGRLHVTRHLWVPEKPLARLNLKIARRHPRAYAGVALPGRCGARPLPGTAGFSMSFLTQRTCLIASWFEFDPRPAQHDPPPPRLDDRCRASALLTDRSSSLASVPDPHRGGGVSLARARAAPLRHLRALGPQ